ncbi:DMT family transporter [Thermospira aquatica]|uniref:DMT family transporter n=1 Tax=Thermospira aquatica TaxID=2828656 RepID=A0AAX3BBA6_9SPIR|nr:DMT family transporter [Thermospira aquatica]URA09598.1 DMT family transporter [Thermospira aquatica]
MASSLRIGGFFVGDILLFWSFVVIGSRMSLLIMLLYPFVSALGASVVFGERLSGLQWLAMVGTLLCVGGVVFFHHQREAIGEKRLRGFLAAVGGMLGQAGGALLAKPALGANTFVFEATWIRIVGGLVAFALVVFLSGRTRVWLASARQKDAILATVGGSIFGPFLGVSLFLLGMRYAPGGVATTLSSLSPVILIGRDVVKGKHVHILEILLTCGAVIFLYLFFA